MSERVVYRSGVGRICPDCGWPAADCHCSRTLVPDEAVPERVTAKLRLDRSGRGGKTVTVIAGLPANAAFLAELASSLKRSCGTGGGLREGGIELSGDVRERVRALLSARGITVKG